MLFWGKRAVAELALKEYAAPMTWVVYQWPLIRNSSRTDSDCSNWPSNATMSRRPARSNRRKLEPWGRILNSGRELPGALAGQASGVFSACYARSVVIPCGVLFRIGVSETLTVLSHANSFQGLHL